MKTARAAAALGAVSCIALPLLALTLSGCPEATQGAGKGGADGGESLSIVGAGATFPYPLYSKWMTEYDKVKPNVKINYQSIGSGGGQKQLKEKTIDFGASDAPLSDEQLAKWKEEGANPVLHIPMTLGAVVCTYNVPGVTESLKLAPDVVVAIFLGDIKSWDDPKLAADNPNVKFPAGLAITPVYRSDGSGTTYVFTDYLSKINATFKEKVGKATAVKWPAGIGGKGNEGVTGQVKQTSGAFGYVELIYAKANALPMATLKNKAGKWVEPSMEGVTAAAGTAELTEDLRMSIVDAPGDAAYPISSFTWILVYNPALDQKKGKAVAEFLDWGLTDGQKFSSALHYAPLPSVVVEKARAKVKAISFDGKPLLNGG